MIIYFRTKLGHLTGTLISSSDDNSDLEDFDLGNLSPIVIPSDSSQVTSTPQSHSALIDTTVERAALRDQQDREFANSLQEDQEKQNQAF